jgi:hypothetical protein
MRQLAENLRVLLVVRVSGAGQPHDASGVNGDAGITVQAMASGSLGERVGERLPYL